MQIPVCHIASYNSIIGTVYYDNYIFRFKDTKDIVKRTLPVQDYVSCVVEGSNICTVVGKSYKRNTFMVCYGDNFVYEITRDILLRHKVSNIRITKDNRIICVDGRLPDLTALFPDSRIRFQSVLKEVQASSLGVAKKFFAKYNKMDCVVKFSKRRDNKDIENEERYYKVAKLLGVSCCEVKLSEYYGRNCVISFYAYKRDTDVFKSFKSLGRSIKDIYGSFCKADKVMFDKMLILDYLLNQQDRHMSNIAVCNDRLYPLFDNGECLDIGTIGYFSSNFRKYVMSLDKSYIKTIMPLTIDIVNKVTSLIDSKVFWLNAKELGAWDL